MGTTAEGPTRRGRGAGGLSLEPLRFSPPIWASLVWATILVVLAVDEQLASSFGHDEVLQRLTVLACYLAASVFPFWPRVALTGGLGLILLASASVQAIPSVAVPLLGLALGTAVLARAELVVGLLAGVVLWAAVLGSAADAGDRVTEFWRGMLLVVPFIVVGRLIHVLVLRRLAERARMRSLREQAARARQRERQALAQDLHDAVAHELTLMSVQAATHRRTPGGDPDVLIHSLETGARTALVELRALMSLLMEQDPRHDAEGVHLVPALAGAGRGGPLVRLEAVVEHVEGSLSAAGFTCSARVEVAENIEVSPAQVSAVVRVLQEAATNIAKHAAPGSTCTVQLMSRGDHLDLEVANELCTERPDAQQVLIFPGIGRGLSGMSERVELAGGSVAAGPAGGRWRVHARFPLGGKEKAEVRDPEGRRTSPSDS